MDNKKTPAVETLAVGLLIIVAGAAFASIANIAALPTEWKIAVGAVGLVGGGIIGNMGSNYFRAVAAGQTVTFADLESWAVTAAQNVVTSVITGMAAHQAAQLVMQPAQNTINITTPPSATSTDTLPITPAPDAAANADRLTRAMNALPDLAPQATPEPPSSDVSASVVDVPLSTVITPTAPPEDAVAVPTAVLQFVTDSAGNRYQITPA